jgi:hypothetical protein
VADVGNGAHHESAAEGCDTLVESTDLDPFDLSRDQVRMEGETVVVTRRVDPRPCIFLNPVSLKRIRISARNFVFYLSHARPNTLR